MSDLCMFYWAEEGLVQCDNCGRQIVLPPSIDPSTLTAPCRQPGIRRTCKHRGEAKGDPVKLKCCSKRTVTDQPYECALHGRCLSAFPGPFSSDQDVEQSLYTLCVKCSDWTPPRNRSEPLDKPT